MVNTKNNRNDPLITGLTAAWQPADSLSLELFYGANQQRNKAVRYRNDTLENTRYYINKYYEKEIDHLAGTVSHFHYIYGDNGVVALRIFNETANKDTFLNIHTDHLGSYIALATNAKVVQRNMFDVWGNSIPDSLNFTITNRGFTGHEHYPYFKIINMNGRLYDPVIGRFFSPDKYVANSSFTQDFNRYTYARNNPLLYTDPDGEIVWLAAVAAAYFLFFTDAGYNFQKLISPVAVKVDLRFGSNQGGIGIDASVGVPQALPLSYRAHWGATYFWKNTDLKSNNMSGWETRKGGEWAVSTYALGVPLIYRYSGTTFNSAWSGKQTTNTHFLGNPLINVQYENDMWTPKALSWIPGVPKGDGDRYRTAAFQLNIGPLHIGTNMITGDAGPYRDEFGNYKIDANGNKIYIPNNGYDPDEYRNGIIYFGFGPFRFGWNSEANRHVFQNIFAHNILTGGKTYWFDVLSLKKKFYWQFGYSGGGTLW